MHIFINKNYKEQKEILDIGANIGNHTAFFAEFANCVFAFEPHPKNFKLLDINLNFGFLIFSINSFEYLFFLTRIYLIYAAQILWYIYFLKKYDFKKVEKW